MTPPTHPLVIARRGTIPLVVSVPHDGDKPISGVERRRDRDASGEATVRDLNTIPLALEMGRWLERLSRARGGGRPYLVYTTAARRYVDMNRPEAEAYEDPDAAPCYRAYHASLRTFLREVWARWPQAASSGALLMDLHGQATFRESLVRGTRDGQTVSRLIARHGKAALVGPDSVFGGLEARGYQVVPPGATPDAPEPRAFRGGFIVATYGSHHGNGIDAIQFEVGTALRTNRSRRDRLARALAESVAAFRVRYALPVDG
jgi:N-formylglutamate amidohydrolase